MQTNELQHTPSEALLAHALAAGAEGRSVGLGGIDAVCAELALVVELLEGARPGQEVDLSELPVVLGMVQRRLAVSGELLRREMELLRGNASSAERTRRGEAEPP